MILLPCDNVVDDSHVPVSRIIYDRDSRSLRNASVVRTVGTIGFARESWLRTWEYRVIKPLSAVRRDSEKGNDDYPERGSSDVFLAWKHNCLGVKVLDLDLEVFFFFFCFSNKMNYVIQRDSF